MTFCKSITYYLIILGIIFSFSACKEEYYPKPKGYFRIDLPAKEYIRFDEKFPYSFNYPKYSLIYKFKEDSFWVNIFYPKFRATIYLTYKPLLNNKLSNFTEQTRTFAFKHSLKADAIGETPFVKEEKQVYGLLYDIKGNTASSINFYLTDSTKNFISGALYFNSKPNKDSLAPVISFIKQDIVELFESFEWKNN